MEGLGLKLKALRGKQYTQKQVSEATGIPISTITAYENNTRQPGLNNLRTLASFYGVSPGYLLNDDKSLINNLPQDLREIFLEVTNRPSLKLLFKEGKKLTEEEVLLICQLIGRIKKGPGVTDI